MSPSSARGPSIGLDRIKPELGAPGASVSARVGSGTLEQPFGGTSGAAPMVAGAAAQLRQAFPSRTPLQIKAMLMNTAATDVALDPVKAPNVLAPISRIGAGELRVDRAVRTELIAFNAEQRAASLSYGFQAVSHIAVFRQDLVVQNVGETSKVVKLSVDYRYEEDGASGALEFRMPDQVFVPAGGSTSVPIVVVVDPNKLPTWQQNASDLAAMGATFSNAEYDGYVTLADGDSKITVPWHIVPRKASEIHVTGGGSVRTPVVIANSGAESTASEVFALTGTSPPLTPEPMSKPHPIVDLRAVGAHLFGQGTDIIVFGISTYERRTNPLTPAGFEVNIDVNRDGKPDFIVYNAMYYGTVPVSSVFDLNKRTDQAAFVIPGDMYSTNMIMDVPLSMLGLTPDSTFDFSVEARDSAQSGIVTDRIDTMTFTPSKPKFALSDPEQEWHQVAPGKVTFLQVRAVPNGDKASPSQTGLLFLQSGDARESSATVTFR
jgi:hypothetical protein